MPGPLRGWVMKNFPQLMWTYHKGSQDPEPPTGALLLHGSRLLWRTMTLTV